MNFHPLNAEKTRNRETLERGNLCIAKMGLLPGLQKMNTKCGKTLNRDSTALVNTIVGQNYFKHNHVYYKKSEDSEMDAPTL
jgi:hypothetical protein